MGHAVVNYTLFIDECGYNICNARSQGRALRGERAYRQVCGQRGKNVTVALAISPTSGLVFHSAILGGIMVPSLSPNVESGSGLCRRTYQDASITKQSKDSSLKLRCNFEILFPFIVCHYYTNV